MSWRHSRVGCTKTCHAAGSHIQPLHTAFESLALEKETQKHVHSKCLCVGIVLENSTWESSDCIPETAA
jgi:hypothetical protein